MLVGHHKTGAAVLIFAIVVLLLLLAVLFWYRNWHTPSGPIPRQPPNRTTELHQPLVLGLYARVQSPQTETETNC